MNPIRVGLMQPNQQQDNCDGWRDKLVGKIIVGDEAVTTIPAGKFVRKSELPSSHRILGKNSVATMDYRPDRLNIHVDDDKRVKGVNYG